MKLKVKVAVVLDGHESSVIGRVVQKHLHSNGGSKAAPETSSSAQRREEEQVCREFLHRSAQAGEILASAKEATIES